jgi:hypothetical protein
MTNNKKTTYSLGIVLLAAVLGVLVGLMFAGSGVLPEALDIDPEEPARPAGTMLMILAPSAGVAPVLPFLAIVSAQERWGRRCQLCHATAEAVVDAPCAEIDVNLTVVVDEGLTIEGDGIMNKAVLHKDCVVAAQYVLPRAERRRAYTLVQNAWLTVEVAIEAVGSLHHVGCPHHLGCRPVHDVIGPRAEVL